MIMQSAATAHDSFRRVRPTSPQTDVLVVLATPVCNDDSRLQLSAKPVVVVVELVVPATLGCNDDNLLSAAFVVVVVVVVVVVASVFILRVVEAAAAGIWSAPATRSLMCS